MNTWTTLSIATLYIPGFAGFLLWLLQADDDDDE